MFTENSLYLPCSRERTFHRKYWLHCVLEVSLLWTVAFVKTDQLLVGKNVFICPRHSTHQCNFIAVSLKHIWFSVMMFWLWGLWKCTFSLGFLLLSVNFEFCHLVSCYQHLPYATAWTGFHSFMCGDFHTHTKTVVDLIGWRPSESQAIKLQLLKTCIYSDQDSCNPSVRAAKFVLPLSLI